MWFKNLQIYRFSEKFSVSPEQVDEALSEQAFAPCRGLDTHRIGWVAPLGRQSEQLAHACSGRIMLCMRREERILPAAVVREALEEKVEAISIQEGRRVGRKEKSELRDEIIVDLLPRAFTRSRLIHAYIDPQNGWIVIDSATPNRAEDLLGLLRESLGSLKVKPLAVNHAPADSMTDWTLNRPPTDLEPGDECELRKPAEKGVIRIRGVDLGSHEVLQHLKSGRYVSRLSLQWLERIAFVLSEDLAIKRLRFLDLVMEEASDIVAEDEVARFDADFSLMSMELGRLIPALCDHLGGIETD